MKKRWLIALAIVAMLACGAGEVASVVHPAPVAAQDSMWDG